MISKDDLEEAYRQRGLATDKERLIEDVIFQKDALHSDKEMSRLLKLYSIAKQRRAAASIRAAKLFMLAAPSIRRQAEWRKFTPGHESDKGRGESIL